jgi:CRP-like cAMP-binding protein
MLKARSSSVVCCNKLLALLPWDEYQRILTRVQLVPFEFKKILYEPGHPIRHAYFPQEGVVSMITVMEDGDGIEVATIGNEGMVGLPIFFGDAQTSCRFIVQVPGNGLRMSPDVLHEETRGDTPLRKLLLLYQSAFIKQISQSVACNGLHNVLQRCCRWLLMCHDRVEADVFPMTHEFLSQMLGVRRSSVSEVLHPLQEKGWIRNGRGKITIVNRAELEADSCECYRSVNDEFERLFG